jgi:hypothetical protein
MHCPNCGQQQISNETKFCSRCGFPLGLIAQVLSHGGFLPQLAELNKNKSIFTKKNGVVFGVFWFIFFTMLMTSIVGIAGGPDELAGISAVIGVFGTLMIIIGSLVFLRSSKEQARYHPTQMPPAPSVHGIQGGQQGALPPQQAIPVSAYAAPQAGRWRDTKDLEPTSSVTEETTRLLENEQK